MSRIKLVTLLYPKNTEEFDSIKAKTAVICFSKILNEEEIQIVIEKLEEEIVKNE